MTQNQKDLMLIEKTIERIVLSVQQDYNYQQIKIIKKFSVEQFHIFKATVNNLDKKNRDSVLFNN